MSGRQDHAFVSCGQAGGEEPTPLLLRQRHGSVLLVCGALVVAHLAVGPV